MRIIKGDAYVMAFGSYSTAMLKGLVDIPVYPLKGYFINYSDRSGGRRAGFNYP